MDLGNKYAQTLKVYPAEVSVYFYLLTIFSRYKVSFLDYVAVICKGKKILEMEQYRKGDLNKIKQNLVYFMETD